MLLLATTLSDLLAGLTPDQHFVLILVMIGCGTGVLITLGIIFAATYGSVREKEYETDLKRELVAQGKSAEEIEKILKPSDGFSRAIGEWGCRKKR